jgi:hypothetical protein
MTRRQRSVPERSAQAPNAAPGHGNSCGRRGNVARENPSSRRDRPASIHVIRYLAAQTENIRAIRAIVWLCGIDAGVAVGRVFLLTPPARVQRVAARAAVSRRAASSLTLSEVCPNPRRSLPNPRRSLSERSAHAPEPSAKPPRPSAKPPRTLSEACPNGQRSLSELSAKPPRTLGEVSPNGQRRAIYSYRSARIGSTRDARWAGMKPAPSATAASAATAPAITAGSDPPIS